MTPVEEELPFVFSSEVGGSLATGFELDVVIDAAFVNEGAVEAGLLVGGNVLAVGHVRFISDEVVGPHGADGVRRKGICRAAVVRVAHACPGRDAVVDEKGEVWLWVIGMRHGETFVGGVVGLDAVADEIAVGAGGGGKGGGENRVARYEIAACTVVIHGDGEPALVSGIGDADVVSGGDDLVEEIDGGEAVAVRDLCRDQHGVGGGWFFRRVVDLADEGREVVAEDGVIALAGSGGGTAPGTAEVIVCLGMDELHGEAAAITSGRIADRRPRETVTVINAIDRHADCILKFYFFAVVCSVLRKRNPR